MQLYTPKTRYNRFIELYIANGFCNVYRAALMAGYARTTAHSHGKRILDTALRKMLEQARVSNS